MSFKINKIYLKKTNGNYEAYNGKDIIQIKKQYDKLKSLSKIDFIANEYCLTKESAEILIKTSRIITI